MSAIVKEDKKIVISMKDIRIKNKQRIIMLSFFVHCTYSLIKLSN